MILTVRRRTAGTRDAHGNVAVTYAAGTPWTVRGVAPGAMLEPAVPNRDRSDIAWTVYADASPDVPGALDRVEWDGVTYEVDGTPKDWTHGPWENPAAGVVVELKRMEG
jgi:hypothetical protein